MRRRVVRYRPSPLCRAANPRRRRPDHPQDFRKPPRPDVSDHIFPNNRERSTRPAESQAHCSNPFEALPLRPSPNQAAPERTYRVSSCAPSGTGLNRGKFRLLEHNHNTPAPIQKCFRFPHRFSGFLLIDTAPSTSLPAAWRISAHLAALGTRKQSPDESKRRAFHRSRRPQCGAAHCRGHPLYTHVSSRSRFFQPNRTIDRIIEPSVTASSNRPAHEPTQTS